jgi:uncharacterized protein (DUF305 family)
MVRLAMLLVTVLGTGLLAGACSTADHNDADVAFATDMIEHHAQAIQMANFTIGREGLDPRIARLAEEIRVDQTREIDTMSGWLRDWDEPVPETGFATGDEHTHPDDPYGSMDGDHGDMPGMMSAGELRTLAEAPADEFDTLWIQMMVAHHAGAIRMAQEVQDEGRSEDVADLAADIESAQRAEVKDLEAWLDAA